MSSCTHSSRNAEQRWPADRKAEVDDVVGHLLGQRGGVDDHGVDAAGLGDERNDRTVLAASVRLIDARDFGRAGEGDAGDAWIGRPARAPILPSPGTRCSALAGTPASCSSAPPRAAISGVCSAGLATTALPAASARRDLAGEDRQRKVPRADADEDAAAAIAQLLLSPVGPGSARGGEAFGALAA